ncbi:MAG: sigma factor-like helix-turn-helix DNA-binding protein, partial [Candidatus Competibacterales bacterium]|nr:sigma factor-like helix-turn-helix DNA-binding protein [Candidatus Competibacterales bacterium]
FNLRSSKKRLGWLNAEETAAVADDLGVSREAVQEMESRLSGQDVSFDPAPEIDDDEAYAPAVYLADPGDDPAAALEREDWDHKTGQALVLALDSLDARSRDIIERRWLGEDKPTLHELAAEYGVSAERIRQIESSALKKLKARMAA